MADPVGIRRPNLADLQEADDYADIVADLIAFVRGRFAAAKDRVSVWQLPPLPETQECPALGVAYTGRGTRSHR
jgi:hypothetical protein